MATGEHKKSIELQRLVDAYYFVKIRKIDLSEAYTALDKQEAKASELIDDLASPIVVITETRAYLVSFGKQHKGLTIEPIDVY